MSDGPVKAMAVMRASRTELLAGGGRGVPGGTTPFDRTVLLAS